MAKGGKLLQFENAVIVLEALAGTGIDTYFRIDAFKTPNEEWRNHDEDLLEVDVCLDAEEYLGTLSFNPETGR